MTKIVFTSCMDAERVPDQPVWDQIRDEAPDVLMLLGDQIYMDWGDLGGPEWRKLITREPVEGLRAFATEMHRRYALQWAVPGFQALICGFAGRADPSRLLVTWDDHDYAWNNSLGVDGDDDHCVPQPVKHVARRLFGQFLEQLRGADQGASYPALPATWNAPLEDENASHLFWHGALHGAGGPECLLLDTRWHREVRAAGASILGTKQRVALRAAVSRSGAGLLVVVAGTPMNHSYQFSQQAWHDPHGFTYAEYDEALASAQRPVLFLGGDVHRNVWSGRLRQTNGTLSRVVQVLSSGAAIGRIGPKRFAPSYGVVTLPATWATAGEVTVQLRAKRRVGGWQDDPAIGAPLPFNNSDWAETLHGEAESKVDAAADTAVLTVLCARPRASSHRLHEGHAVVAFSNGIKGLDAVFKNAPLDGDSYAETLELQVEPGTVDSTARLQFQGNVHDGNNREAELHTLIGGAFERARVGNKRSVVLFIHGFGKSFEASLAQAYGLRQAFPECEPILYSWEAGRAGGVLAALTGVGAARHSAKVGVHGLSAVLKAFGGAEENGMSKVIVARSAGSLALSEALWGQWETFSDEINRVQRVVLSAPLLKWSEYKRNKSFVGLKTQVVVTCNRNDQTLKFADWIDGFGPMLGLEEGFVGASPSQICLDFTDSPRVGRLHDYLFLKINPAQSEINRRLMTESVFDPLQAVEEHLLGAENAGVFHVQ